MLRLAFCVAGIYACFLSWGVLQERVSTTPYGNPPKKFKYFVFLNLIQAITASLVAFIYLKITGRSLGDTRPLVLLRYAQVAIFSSVAAPFGYESLKYIDYPTMILGKSCKLVPVMFMNVVLYRRQFPLYKYICVLLITAGVSLFMFTTPSEGKHKGAAANSIYGLFLLAINLIVDGLTNSTQDQIFHTYRITGQQMMFFMNIFSAGFMFIYLTILTPLTTGHYELSAALKFCGEHPIVWVDVLLFALCGAVGQCFIFFTLENYGSLSLVTVTVTRKLFTMLLSVFWFGHVLSGGQWGGVILVFTGIGLEAYVNRMKKLQQMEKYHVDTAKNVAAVEAKEMDGGVISNGATTNGIVTDKMNGNVNGKIKKRKAKAGNGA